MARGRRVEAAMTARDHGYPANVPSRVRSLKSSARGLSCSHAEEAPRLFAPQASLVIYLGGAAKF